MEEYSIDPIKLFLEREEKIQTLPYFPPEKKRKRTNHLVNELQKKKI